MATNAADAGEEQKISLVVEFSCVPLSCPSFHNAVLFQKPFLPRGRFCLRPCHEDDSDTNLIWNRACMLLRYECITDKLPAAAAWRCFSPTSGVTRSPFRR